MEKLVELLHSDLSNVQYLALEAIYALCARNSTSPDHSLLLFEL